MAAPAPRPAPISPDTPVVIKATLNGENRRFKLPLKELGAHTLPLKLRQILDIPPDTNIIVERWSDSAAAYVILDSENQSVYKQLYRAAKAKLKLRLKITRVQRPPSPPAAPARPSKVVIEEPQANGDSETSKTTSVTRNYLDTVLGDPAPASPFACRAPTDPAASAFGAPYQYLNGKSPRNHDLSKTWADSCSSFPPVIPGLCWGTSVSGFPGAFCIDCNNCGATIPNEHYHCSICEQGDYDLCPSCIDAGVYCPGDGHWLIKRTINHGVVTTSTTEIIAPQRRSAKVSEQAQPEPTPAPEPEREPVPEPEQEPKLELVPVPEPVPEPETQSQMEVTSELGVVKVTDAEPQPAEVVKPAVRTCNACFEEHAESDLLTCKNCSDYDLCLACLRDNTHGHHPGHEFAMIDDSMSDHMKRLMSAYCRPGGHKVHAAICDGCEKHIIGVRHKCLNCPDWDYCSDCIKKAPEEHAGHRFAPIYEPIGTVTERSEVHFGVLCDGPLCRKFSRGTYISGVRYKCTICHDTDFCANCEAHPSNTHNRTHPLIKFKTPVRHVSVSTFGEDERGAPLSPMGDRRSTKSASTETVAPLISNAATQVQNYEAESVTLTPEPAPAPEKEVAPVEEEQKVEPAPPTGLQAFFVKDTVVDGTNISPSTTITQTWTLYNPGPLPWPKGCCVRFIGGDAMFNIDTNHPTSVENLVSAMESPALSQPVGPLESADFTVTLKSPARIGRAISYWRLKTADGEPFGHKLWCDVNVVPAEEEKKSSAEITELPVTEAAEMAASAKSATLEPEVEEKPATESEMIFPKLEKESPDASIHAAQPPPSKEPADQDEDHELVDDVESLTIDDEEETEDGFLTDEEYDILDASDQEYAVEAQKSAQK
ncbi:hypothetical protein VTO42DRAFT_7037 [Malbranchea cinnamomea]